MRLSVIIPTCHRNFLLLKCLERLAPGAQTLPSDAYEVIITDDGFETTASHIILERFPWAKWVKGPTRGPAANRNNGARQALNEWLVFLDDDCLPNPGLLAAYLDAAEKNGTRVIEGRIYGEHPQESLAESAPLNESGGYLWSCNFAILKQLFDSMGGFDERFPHASMEDVDFRLRLNRAGERIEFVPGAAVCHPWRRRNVRKEFPRYEESLSIYLSIHPDQKKEFTLKIHLWSILRSFIKVTLPGLLRYRGAGFGEAMLYHWLHLHLAVCGLPDRSKGSAPSSPG